MIDIKKYQKTCASFYKIMHRGRGGVYIGDNKLLIGNIIGQRLICDARDHANLKTLFLAKAHEISTLALITHLVKPGMVCIDINAGCGFYSLFLGTLVGPQGKIYSFEGVKENCDLLAKNADLNDLPSVAAINAFIGEDAKSIEHHYFENAWPFFFSKPGDWDSKTVKSQTASLDNSLSGFQESLFDFMFINGESCLPDIWKGMQNTLAANRHMNIICRFDRAKLYAAGTIPKDFLEEIEQHYAILELPTLEKTDASKLCAMTIAKTLLIKSRT